MSDVDARQEVPARTIAFKIVSSFRMHAINATFAGLPAAALGSMITSRP